MKRNRRGLAFWSAQGYRVERTTELRNGKSRHEVVYGVTSLGPDRADEARVLQLLRGHWTIEALHHIRDVTYDEDRSQIRTGSGPQVMAALGNLAIALAKNIIRGGPVSRIHHRLLMHPDRILNIIGA